MSKIVLFQMWGPFRQSLIDAHLFYIEQSKNRLLNQFENMETEADQAAEDWLAKMSQHFNPDTQDPGDYYDSANDAGIEFYQLLSDMKKNTYLSVVAGMYHEWEKQFRDWTVSEINHWHRGDNVKSRSWSVNIGELFEFYKSLGWDAAALPCFSKIDACRLVVNTYKHGPGNSFDELKVKYPEYFLEAKEVFAGLTNNFDFLNYGDMAVSLDQIDEFSQAIVDFWNEVPENILSADDIEVPSWFKKAYIKDTKDN
jgi:hypothetical protein